MNAWNADQIGPQHTTRPDTIRQLESVASADLVAQGTVDVLTGAYRAYRTRTHHLSLEGGNSIVPATEFTAERAAVTAIWNETMVSNPAH